MASKIRVYGKAQNRTALGIANAYLRMYPHATLDDLNQAFPVSLNTDGSVSSLFVTLDQARSINDKTNNISLYFAKDGEALTLADGSQVCFAQVWSKKSFDKIVDHARLYDIEIAQFDPAEKGFGKKGSWALEMLNGYVPPVPDKKKGMPIWVWILIALLAAAAIAALLIPRDKEVVVEEKIVERVIVDTVYVQQIEEIEANFNAAQFEVNKADLNDDAKLALHDLAKVLRQNPEIKLDLVGHTSAEGDPEANLQLSQRRAQAAVDFLVEREGIDASRLTAIGKGSSEPIDPNNLEINRRTEFEIK